jgi:ribosomal protein S18 acetylase RimI-like enzyme
MPEIEVRPAEATDIPALIALDHNYTSDHVWQTEFHHDREDGQVTVKFRQVRLPRAVRVEYPRSPHALEEDWSDRSGLLVALLDGVPVGYISLMLVTDSQTAWVTDLIIQRRLRRKGIGSALVLAALEWAGDMDCQDLVLEMQPKNYPSIKMALKLGFEFCGYKDRYFPNQEVGIFFCRSVR